MQSGSCGSLFQAVVDPYSRLWLHAVAFEVVKNNRYQLKFKLKIQGNSVAPN